MSHTPGPWAVVGGPSKYNQVYAEGAKTSETSAFLTGWIAPANAHLIAAAPALLEAAEDLANAVDWDRDILELDEDGYEAMRAKYDRNVDWINAAVAHLRAAIRQARGEK